MSITASHRSLEHRLATVSSTQRERLAFIDFNLQFFGKVSRVMLVERFETGLAASTRDFASYKEIAPDNLLLDHSTKHYLRTPRFSPVFKFSADAILQSVSRGFVDGITSPSKPSTRCFEAVQLIHPNTDIIAALMRAISNGHACTINYVSVSSGETRRRFVPHALINNGHRWHVRGYDGKSKSFRDFVCTRFIEVKQIAQPREPHEKAANDAQFNKIVDLVLIPHPSLENSRAIEMDYDMKEGKKVMRTRAALAAYILRQWQVDCSQGHRILKQGCQLALQNHDVLASIENPMLAPGNSCVKK